MKMVIFSLIFFGLANLAVADLIATGVDDKGVAITDAAETLYVVHGGCREYNNNRNLTEIWLYFSRTANVNYDPNLIGTRIIRAQMFLNTEFRKNLAVVVCNGLRTAYKTQEPLQISLKPHPHWQDIFNVKSVKTSDVDAINITWDRELLGNFSVTDKDDDFNRKK
jgi:hypothetical protein